MAPFEKLLRTAQHAHELLDKVGIPHAIIGGFAVVLHGYSRPSRDIDLLINPSNKEKADHTFGSSGYKWLRQKKAFESPLTKERLDLRFSGLQEIGEVPLPDPGVEKSFVYVSSLPALSLPHLISAKMDCILHPHPSAKQRHIHKHRNDILALIATTQIDATFANMLHPAVRGGFHEILAHVRIHPEV